MSREYPCVYYDNQKCKKFEEPGYTSWCVLGPCSHETPSGADLIRAMSDEELADVFVSAVVGALSGFWDEEMIAEAAGRLREKYLEFLQAPAKDGVGDA